MTKFKPLELGDRDLYKKYLGGNKFNTYEYSFLALYFWRKMCNTEYCIIDNSLVLKKTTKDAGSYFMQPLGCTDGHMYDLVMKLNSMTKNDPKVKSLFRDVEFPFLSQLLDIFDNKICLCDDYDNFDYIYNTNDLISLSGNKLHRKRNQYNQFIRNYRYVLKDIGDDTVAAECIDFAKSWYNRRKEDSEQLKYELEGIEEILSYRNYLNLKGMAVYVGGTIAGFTIGERINDKMAVIHVEKGDFKYSGIYSFLNKAFAERYFSDVEFINRQEDLGSEGLRQAKMAYNPVKLEKKFIVSLTLEESES